MSFPTDMNTVATAIDELSLAMGVPPRNMQMGEWGPAIVCQWGHGAWNRRGNSNYFNCGVDERQNTAPPQGGKGLLSVQDGYNMELWFTRDAPGFANFRPNVLKTARSGTS